MLAGIREVLLISTPRDLPAFRGLLADGEHLGLRVGYGEQAMPGGLAQAFAIGRDYLEGRRVCLVLGDTLLFGNELGGILRRAARLDTGAQVLAYRVADATPSGVVELDAARNVVSIAEKPPGPRSGWAVPGLDVHGPDVCDLAATFIAAVQDRHRLMVGCLEEIALPRGRLDPAGLEAAAEAHRGTGCGECLGRVLGEA